MRLPFNPIAEAAGASTPRWSASADTIPPAHSAIASGGRPAIPARPFPDVSRRSVLATMAAALAPAAGAAVVLPKVVGTAAAVLVPTETATPALAPTGLGAESLELLALGVELEAKLEAYRVAAERLAEARATAAALWPAAPATIVSVAGNRHTNPSRNRYPGCMEEEVDFEGRQWPDIGTGGGKGSPLPRFIAVSGALAMLLDDVRAEPEAFEEGFEHELIARIAEAETYEDARAEAIEASGIEEAKAEAEACAEDLRALADDVEEHPPRTLAGVLIHARTLTACAEAERDGLGLSSPVKAATILGRGLAEAVLRVAGMKG